MPTFLVVVLVLIYLTLHQQSLVQVSLHFSSSFRFVFSFRHSQQKSWLVTANALVTMTTQRKQQLILRTTVQKLKTVISSEIIMRVISIIMVISSYDNKTHSLLQFMGVSPYSFNHAALRSNSCITLMMQIVCLQLLYHMHSLQNH